jgi:hypothetical protein
MLCLGRKEQIKKRKLKITYQEIMEFLLRMLKFRYFDRQLEKKRQMNYKDVHYLKLQKKKNCKQPKEE